MCFAELFCRGRILITAFLLTMNINPLVSPLAYFKKCSTLASVIPLAPPNIVEQGPGPSNAPHASKCIILLWFSISIANFTLSYKSE